MAKSASEFVEKLQEDEQFAKTVKERVSKNPKKRHEIVSEMGYEFTDDEFEAALKAAGADQSEGELSEDELEGVAGGLTSFSYPSYTLSTSTTNFSYSFQSTDLSTMDGTKMGHATYW